MGDSVSVLDFEYLYNGGGVAVADFDNDGLLDIYFTGNMVSSRLYLNRGDFRFEDVTEKAGVATTRWANGVAAVDINQDGWEDIYISVGGSRSTPDEDRANLLFVNKGDGTFVESAEAYGLADKGFGIQSVFFDYDRDGDLDMYHLRNAFVSYSRNASRPKLVNGEAASTDRLYRNNGDNTFTDVSREAGVLIEGFGLGVAACDINEDGWTDIYVSNDFITNDLLYINNGDGTFTNRVGDYLKHQTHNGMGCDVADYNNDGAVDIVVLDMLPEDNKRWKLTSRGNTYDEYQNGIRLGYQHQYIRNTLQLNNRNGTFSEIGQLAGIEATEWSWSALLADYDNDGLKDLFVTNGYKQDITNLDFTGYGDKMQTMGMPAASELERQALLDELPGIHVHNYLYRNKGDLTFEEMSGAWGLSTPTYSNGAAFADLDNDGDLDLVVNNIDEPASILESHLIGSAVDGGSNFLRVKLEGPPMNREGYGTTVYLRHDGTLQHQYFNTVRGYLSSVEPIVHFGIGRASTIDTVEVVWPDGKFQRLLGTNGNQLVTLRYVDAEVRPAVASPAPKARLFRDVADTLDIRYKHQENEFVDFKLQPTLPHMHSRNGPGITVGDINGDGLEDFYIAGAKGHAGGLFVQTANGKFERLSAPGIDSLAEDMGVLFFDADNDRDLDLYIVSGGSESRSKDALLQDRLYINDGRGNFALDVAALPELRQSGSSVIAADYDRDGDLDLFVGGRIEPGSFPLPGESFLLRNDSRPGICRFTSVAAEVAPGLGKIGMVCDARWTDFNNDGWQDLIVVGEFMPITFFENVQGRLEDITRNTGLDNTSGWWNSLVAGDFDDDGDTDYLIGNLGANSHFHATRDEPLCVYASDFDKDGRLDPVMSYYVQGVKYVGHSRDNLIDQIHGMRTRFRTYTDYANATFEESFLPEELADAYIVCSQTFESSYLENRGHGKFQLRKLPLAVQFAPVYGMLADDYDGDGKLDVLLVGNSYAPEVSSGRDDASIGLYLKGDGHGGFAFVPSAENGFLADGDQKGMANIVVGDTEAVVLVGCNDGELRAYSAGVRSAYVQPAGGDTYAIITHQDGSATRHEFYYGSTYLSQSSRQLRIPPTARSIVLYDGQGNSRQVQLPR